MWEVVTVELFDEWFLSLEDMAQKSVLASVHVLEIKGPQLGRPHVDTLEGTSISNLKELRIQHKGAPLRAFFAFDPVRKAVLLCGGDKTGDKRFYKRMIPIAEREYAEYLDDL